MTHLNPQFTQNTHNAELASAAILLALGKFADSAVAAYTTDAHAVNPLLPSYKLRDWHVGIAGSPTSTGITGTIPGSAAQYGMRRDTDEPMADTRFHVHYRDKDEAIGDC